ncbi:exonuclease SbcD [Arcanobacterium pluranimalium]|uniref:exonuclease SbcCD subunit D n=1 Tax=Arcanobacterium pluranimalium TaxID=108028 RepID=UPI001957931D|nr:exonuclease SbcCD subunit D [Arcanobacterium pluranimalium]MBM7825875.1 exonuclease SbcD [Arcanobacterium pluranimalium]
MRILHTSDWHLGRTFHGADLTPAFEQWCDYVVDYTKSEKIDALLVSGDIYDRGIPPVAMVDLLSDTLARLLDHTQVVITSGNHDSPRRLGFASALLCRGLTICTDPQLSARPVALHDSAGEIGAFVYAIPYLDPDVERRRLSDDPQQLLPRSHEAVMKAALTRIYSHIAQHPDSAKIPRLAMAHAFVTGGEPSDSEQDLHIGGVNSVPSAVFAPPAQVQPLDYIALGHLHGPQKIGSDTRPLIRYSGSPIAFSFSEQHHHKSSVLLDFSATPSPTQADSATGVPGVELVPNPVFRKLATLTDSFENLTSVRYSSYADHFLRIFVTDDERPQNLIARLRKHFPHLVEVRHETTAVEVDSRQDRVAQKSPIGVITEFFESSGGRKLTPPELAYVQKTWEEQGKGEDK